MCALMMAADQQSVCFTVSAYIIFTNSERRRMQVAHSMSEVLGTVKVSSRLGRCIIQAVSMMRIMSV